MCETWKDVPGYEGLYQVSNLGRVKSLDRLVYCKNGRVKHMKGKLLGGKFCGNYKAVPLCGKNKYVHVLVAKAFPEICGVWFPGCQVDHIDTNVLNNVATNLLVCTEHQNHNNPITRKHISKAKHGKHVLGKNPNAKPILQLSTKGEVIKEWACIREAANGLKCHHSTIEKALNGTLKTAYGFEWQFV